MKTNPFEDPQVAQTYDAFYNNPVGQAFDQLEKAAILSIIKELPRGQLLDVGCGTGHWSKFFVDMGFTVTGIDSSAAMLREAHKNFRPDLEYIQTPAESFVSEKKFDSAAFITSLEFMVNPTEVLTNICRSIRPGGTLILGILNEESPLGQSRKSEPGLFANAHFFTETELKELLTPFGDVTLLQSTFAIGEQILAGESIFEIEQEALAAGKTTGAFIAGRVILK